MLTFINLGSITAATPDLSGTFVVGTLDVSWSGAACPLGMALSFTCVGYLLSRIGLRRSLRFAMVLVAGGAALALATDNFFLMVVARLVQGAGGGLSIACGTGLLNAALPPERRSLQMELRRCSIGVASCVSPIVGCVLVQYASWRWLFAAVGAAAVVLGILASSYAPNAKIPKSGKFDWFSFLALGAGFCCLLMVIIYGETDGWTAPNVLAWSYGGASALTLAVLSCLTHKSPLLDLRVLGNGRLLCGLAASLCNIFCVCWVRAGTVQFMRNVMHYEPIDIAFVFVFLTLSFGMGAAAVLPLMLRGGLPLRVGMMAGLLCLGGSAFFLARLDANCSWFDVAWPLMVFGGGYALCLHVATPLALRGVGADRLPSAARTVNTVRFLFICLFTSSVSTVLAHMKTNYQFTVAERASEGSPGVTYAMEQWGRQLAQAGKSAADVHAQLQTLMNQALSLQSQVFSTDAFYLTIVFAAALGMLLALLCLRVKRSSLSL